MKELFSIFPHLKSRQDYQKDNFDKFLNKIGFSYDIPSIHIAGTNGKGSTANYIASIYQDSGKKVGLFTSPSLYEINDMILINGQPIKDDDILKIINEYAKFISKYQLSLFEIETFVALTYFQNEHVDMAVIECGMGGLVDATNIFIPILSIITSISLEHTSYLGQSLAEIAIHKGGIIKDNIPCLISSLNEEAEKTITEIAFENEAPLFKVGTVFNINHLGDGINFNYHLLKDVKLNSFAEYACNDAALAIEATTILMERFPVSEANIRNGLLKVHMTARMEVVSSAPLLIADGAHNVEAIHSLVDAINKQYMDKTIHIVFSAFTDKNVALMLPQLALLTNDITLTTFDHERSRKEEDYFLFLEEYKFNADYRLAIRNYLNQYPDDLVLVTGSLAFASLVAKEFKEGLF